MTLWIERLRAGLYQASTWCDVEGRRNYRVTKRADERGYWRVDEINAGVETGVASFKLLKDADDFLRRIEVTRTNLMSKKRFTERADTPYYCSPSSEAYWSS